MTKDRTALVINAYNEHAKYLRGQLGRQIDMKFTPDLRFMHDESFAKAAFMDRLFDKPEVKRDLQKQADDDLDER
jgi:ribosome-binding factor A